MKRSIILLCASVAILSSCKKNYDCSCTANITAKDSITTQQVSFVANKELKEGSEKKAQTACDSHKKDVEVSAADSVYTGGRQDVQITTVVNCNLSKK